MGDRMQLALAPALALIVFAATNHHTPIHRFKFEPWLHRRFDHFHESTRYFHAIFTAVPIVTRAISPYIAHTRIIQQRHNSKIVIFELKPAKVCSALQITW